MVNEIILGAAEKVLERIPSESVHAVVCDPPYGLGRRAPTPEEIDAYLMGARLDTRGDFMGARWELPSLGVWRQCLRVLKPGAYLAAFAGTRTWDLMAAGIKAAGFADDDHLTQRFGTNTLQWTYGSGFPKSLNISKALLKTLANEKKMGSVDPERERQLTAAATKWEGHGTALKPAWEPILCFRKAGPPLVEPKIDASFFYCAKASRRERSVNGRIGGIHPTTKPVALMRWLVRTLAPAGGLVLDPFVGSGTTAIAALYEGRSYIVVERDRKFHRLACDRIEAVQAESREAAEEIRGHRRRS